MPCRLQVLLAVALVAASAGACTSKIRLRITAERSPSVDFYAYRTYAWVSEPPQETRPRGGRNLLNWRIRSAVERQLSARGFEKASSGRPDLLVDYRVDVREKNTETLGDFMAYRESGGKQELMEAYVFGYDEGVLTIEVADAATKHLVWRASAAGLVEPERQGDLVNEAVQRMFERFP